MIIHKISFLLVGIYKKFLTIINLIIFIIHIGTFVIIQIKKNITYSCKYKTWIHTHIRVYILKYTYNYMSSYTIIEIL